MSTLIAAFYFLRRSNALPTLMVRDDTYTVNSTASSDPSWVSPPDIRGTYDLILGCLTTLTLCAWTAYHPNIHPRNSMTNIFFRRLKWMIVAVIFPEGVLFCAWEQRWAAGKLQKEINALGDRVYNGDIELEYQGHMDLPRPPRASTAPGSMQRLARNHTGASSVYSQPERNHSAVSFVSTTKGPKASSVHKFTPWTLEQAFFAVCGGFAVESSSFWHQHQLTFTPDGVLKLARLGILPDVSEATIQDKSKADTVAKLIVCIQAGWFFIGSMARLVQKLPITLLELHILTHVVCTFAVYLLWMKKPYHVESPIICKEQKVVDMAALFAVDANLESVLRIEGDRRLDPVKIEEVRAAHSASGNWLPKTWFTRWVHLYEKTGLTTDVDLIGKDCLECFEDATYKSDGKPATIQKTNEQHIRANRALELLRCRHRSTSLSFVVGANPSSWYRFKRAHVVYARSNAYIDGLDYDPSNDRDAAGAETAAEMQIRTWPALATFSALYGGAHLTAWSMHFPSVVEMWLWRGAAVAMAAFPLNIVVMYAYILLEDLIWPAAPGRDEHRIKLTWPRRIGLWILNAVFVLPWLALVMVPGMAYPFAQMYVLGESFASLRSPPSGTYVDVAWSDFIPHVG